MTARAERSEQRRAPKRSKVSPAQFDMGKLRSTFLLFRFVDLGCDWFNFVDFWGISDLSVVCGRDWRRSHAGRGGGDRETVTNFACRLRRNGTPVRRHTRSHGYFWAAVGGLVAAGGVLMVAVVFWWWRAVLGVSEARQGLPELGAPPTVSGSLPELRVRRRCRIPLCLIFLL
ncbi:hypothetical protein Dimus_022506 [Dionaea muscipula]